jgi:hypothetical protein
MIIGQKLLFGLEYEAVILITSFPPPKQNNKILQILFLSGIYNFSLDLDVFHQPMIIGMIKVSA